MKQADRGGWDEKFWDAVSEMYRGAMRLEFMFGIRVSFDMEPVSPQEQLHGQALREMVDKTAADLSRISLTPEKPSAHPRGEPPD